MARLGKICSFLYAKANVHGHFVVELVESMGGDFSGAVTLHALGKMAN